MVPTGCEICSAAFLDALQRQLVFLSERFSHFMIFVTVALFLLLSILFQ